MKTGRNYPLLLSSQFLSAFGDNALLAVIVGQLTLMRNSGELSLNQLQGRSAIYASLLFYPFVVLAPFAGYLNDRYSKTTWLQGGNLIKLAGTGICALSIPFGYFWQAPGYLIVGLGACFYSPAKYGILPEILKREFLVKANGTVELLTLVAILIGNIVGSLIIDRLSIGACYIILLGIYLCSFLLNLLMSPTPANPSVELRTSVQEFVLHLRNLFQSPRLGKILIGTALFWVCGAAMKINFQPWGLDVLKLTTNVQVSLLGLWLSVGVMAGSMLAGQLHKVSDLTKTQAYGYGLAALLGVLWLVEPFPIWRSWVVNMLGFQLVPLVIALLIIVGMVAGLFLIPLNAALQAESDPNKLGKTIAVQNLYDNLGMILAALITFTCVQFHLSPGQVFLVLAGVVAVVVAWLRIPGRAAPASVPVISRA